MGGSYFAEGGVLHAKTMLAYHRDGRRTAAVMCVVWGAVFGFELFMFLTTGSHPFAFGAGFALLVGGFGVYLHFRHGKKVLMWADKLEVYERIQRDRRIHARKLRGWEL